MDSKAYRRSAVLLAAALALVAGSASGRSDNWPAFRGADAMSQAADDPRLPETWSATENVAWKTPIPGLAWSSPVVWGNRVYLTTVVSEGEVEEPQKGLYFGGNRPEPPQDVHHFKVIALDTATGQTVWDKTVLSTRPQFPKHLKNTFASETPATDGERIYAYFGNVGVYALDLDGNLVWEQPFEMVRTRYGWGTAASPIVHGDLLFIVNDNEDTSFLAALDKRTGEERWRATREEGTNWVTPFVWQHELRTELVTAGTDRVRSYDLDGKLLWELGGMSSIAIPQPFAAHGLLYVSSGYIGDQKRPVFAVRPGASGDITLAEGAQSNEWIVWFQPQAGPYNPTPLVYGDHLYTLLDRGFFTMHDAKTGELVYDKQRIERGVSAFTASPWAYNGKIFVLSEDGDTFVIDAGEEFQVVAKNSLDEMCMATPAIADGSLYIRT
ncbi:MAG TPA: PQQ-binding-like beta-propeller repeat protein, partial [Thermoanaerobaculia bacterium]|nr:PQQ-binding-like beta-propeller repeat protein [Thermoanaerobaculia bacterium]